MTYMTVLYNLPMIFRRYYIPGSAVFITQIVQDRKPVFRDTKNLNLLREILLNIQQLHPFTIWVCFPLYHFHLIFQATGESNFSDIMYSLKPNFTKEYTRVLGLSSSESLKLWQKRFWDHVIREDRDFENHLLYMYYNPVKHGYVKDPRDWTGSSYIEWEKRGLYPPASD
jgi:putative transposase